MESGVDVEVIVWGQRLPFQSWKIMYKAHLCHPQAELAVDPNEHL